MRVAIISDIHDNIPKLRSALSSLDGVEALNSFWGRNENDQERRSY